MIENYYKDLYFVTITKTPDGTGGFEHSYLIGNKFKGTATKTSSSDISIGGVRNNVAESYMVTTYDENNIKQNDILMFYNDGERVFIRVDSKITYTPNISGQRHWKYATATKIEPDLRVVN